MLKYDSLPIQWTFWLARAIVSTNAYVCVLGKSGVRTWLRVVFEHMLR